MLSLSFFIQGLLWMLRLLFSIVRNIFSVAKVTSLWDCSFRVLNVIVIFNVFLVRSCLHITLIKCLKGHKSLGLLFVIVHVDSMSLPLSLSLSFYWSGHVSSSLWLNLSKVKYLGSLSECSMVVFFNNMEDKVTYRAVLGTAKKYDRFNSNTLQNLRFLCCLWKQNQTPEQTV